jgi:type I restriction enzyme S subunit
VSQYKPYPAYKDSGVEWLGWVPEHWDVLSFQRCVAIAEGQVDPEQLPYSEMMLIAPNHIESGSGRMLYSETAAEQNAESGKYLCQAGDVVYSKIRPALKKVCIATESGLCSADMYPMRGHSGMSNGFLFWFLLSEPFSAFAVLEADRVAMPKINRESLNAVQLPRPPLAEQRVIASRLDRETARIDGLVEKKTRFIELLREKRQALITHAVTKGLDPNVKMKDSGVEWLGEVPEHWQVRSVSSVSTKITNGFVGPTRDILVEDGVRYLQSLHIKGNQIKFDVPYFVTEAWSNQHKKSILETGDVLIVQTGDIGQVTVVTDEFAGCNCHALIIVSPIRSILAGEWISWVFNSSYGYHSLLSIQTGAMHPHLNCGNVKDVSLPVPPLEEQRAIIQYVETEERRVAALITKTGSSIELLKERRSALITAAVTGQVDLRGTV